jgi:hypothetical protein
MRSIFKITFALTAILAVTLSFAQKRTVFEYTGSVQEYVVPIGVDSIKVELFGAGGGYGSWEKQRIEDKYAPGKGGRLKVVYKVTSGEKIYIFVGGQGDNATDFLQGKGGYNGGADGRNTGNYGPYCGGGGGGATDIRIGGSGLANRVLVAGGGGGAGSNFPDGADYGGDGGGLIGHNGWAGDVLTDGTKGLLVNTLGEQVGSDHGISVGIGATQTAGGEGGQWPSYLKAEAGNLGKGGTAADSTSGGGGGGGYYGGGGGSWSGGGGGSSFVSSQGRTIHNKQGIQSGNGIVSITPTCAMPKVDLLGESSICHGEEITLTASSDFGSKLSWNNKVINGQAFKPNLGKNIYILSTDNSSECAFKIEIEARPGAPIILATKEIICEGEKVTLSVEDMKGVLFDNGVKEGVEFVPPIGKNTYHVTKTGDCPGEDEILIQVNKLKIDGIITQIEAGQPGSIDITASAGTAPYKYRWTVGTTEVSIEKNINNLKGGTYSVAITDNIGCTETASFEIEDLPVIIDNTPPPPKIKADISADEAFVTVSYPGAFEYKIENVNGLTVITGHSDDSDIVDITRLTSGTYRVSLIYKQIKQYTTFVKN